MTTNREKQRLAKYEREKKTPFVTLNDGVCTVYKLTNTAEAGLKPRLEPTLYRKLNFAYQTIGVKRNYEALQAYIFTGYRCYQRRAVRNKTGTAQKRYTP